MALSSELSHEIDQRGSELGFPVADVWNWQSKPGVDSHDVVILTEHTLFITRDIGADAARKLVMAAAESDLAVSARSAASKRRLAVPLTEIVEVTWISHESKALLHTTSGRAVTLELPSSEFAELVCEAIARKAGYGQRRATDLGRRDKSQRPFIPLYTATAVGLLVIIMNILVSQPLLNVPDPIVWAACLALIAAAGFISFQRLSLKAERISISIDHR